MPELLIGESDLAAYRILTLGSANFYDTECDIIGIVDGEFPIGAKQRHQRSAHSCLDESVGQAVGLSRH